MVVRELFLCFPKAWHIGATSALWSLLRNVSLPFRMVALQIFEPKFIWLSFKHNEWVYRRSIHWHLRYYLRLWCPNLSALSSSIKLCLIHPFTNGSHFLTSYVLLHPYPDSNSFLIYLGSIFLPISVKIHPGSCPMITYLLLSTWTFHWVHEKGGLTAAEKHLQKPVWFSFPTLKFIHLR